jgi:thioesterase domain-containing protein
MEGVDVHVIPGKHGEMVKEPIVQVMAKQLETHLAGIDANEKTV